jgi:hypothetical protein
MKILPRAGMRVFWDPTVPLVGDHGGQKKPNQIRLSFLEEFFLSGTVAVAEDRGVSIGELQARVRPDPT